MSDSDFTRTLKAWHGSPHDFEEFRNEAIGTGEGTAWRGGYGVRGHGHYVAEERRVAESYRDSLHRRYNQSALDATKFRNVSVPDLYNTLNRFVNTSFSLDLHKERMRGNKDESRAEAFKNKLVTLEMDRDYYHDRVEKVFPEFLKLEPEVQDYVRDMVGQIEPGDPLGSYTDHLNRLRENDLYTYDGGRHKYRELVDLAHEFMLPFLKDFRAPEKKEGRLYELNLNLEPHELLDWDADLENHHQDAFQKIIEIPEVEAGMDLEWDDAGEIVGDEPKLHENYSTGEDVYNHLVKELGTAVKASNRLLKHGIKGIRYADQGSRNRSPILELDGNVIDHSTKYWPTHEEIQNDSEARDHRYAMIIAHQADHGHISLDEAAAHMKSSYEQDPQFFGEFPAVLEWYEKNKHRIKFEPPPPTYNYVIFDPTAIKIMRKLGMKGEVVKDFTDTGVHVKPVSHDPFKE